MFTFEVVPLNTSPGDTANIQVVIKAAFSAGFDPEEGKFTSRRLVDEDEVRDYFARIRQSLNDAETQAIRRLEENHG